MHSQGFISFVLALVFTLFDGLSVTAGEFQNDKHDMNLFNLSGDSSGLHFPIYRVDLHTQETGVPVKLGDFMDVTYSIMINIGGTELRVVVDTGSSDLWIIANTCTSSACTKVHGETGMHLYPQPESDTSFNTNCSSGFHSTSLPATLFYGDSITGTHAFGVVGTDSISIVVNTSVIPAHSKSDSKGPTMMPMFTTQYFAAINDTNTSVLDTGCVGILGLGFPLNSALSLEVFEKDHPELNSVTRKGYHDPTDPPAEGNYGKQSQRKGGRNIAMASRMSYSLNRRTFPDLSKFTDVPFNRSASDPRMDSGTEDQQSSGLPRRDSSLSSSSSWTPLLLSTFSISGPPVWRLVTDTTKSRLVKSKQALAKACSSDTKKKQTATLRPMFSVSLQRETNMDTDGRGYDAGTGEHDRHTGVLTIGGLPPGVRDQNLSWAEVRRYGVEDGGVKGGRGAEHEVYPITWEIFIDDVFLDGRKLPRSTLVDPGIGVTGLIDTGNSRIRGPADVIHYIKNLLREDGIETRREKEGSTPISCSIGHSLAFQIEGRLFPVAWRDMIWLNEDEGHCYLNIAPTDAPTRGRHGGGGYLYSWSLGDPFLKSVLASFYYGNTTHPSYDPPRIGLMSTFQAPAN
ncbi:aspartic peptidase domain-containing protein [Rhodocollybia butyracea]|uniref:Aspartic peptidase domain-containing protein n=1 Tax=Rhodocollybia butyracea TaxID=206335 RepID=A0A9P5PXD0_9AGAR|nr:aspartic peptidase domain-containing protein [Rhodocollybia butyracea]